MAEELMGDGAPINIGFKNENNDNWSVPFTSDVEWVHSGS
jgi:hypothetical protein